MISESDACRCHALRAHEEQSFLSTLHRTRHSERSTAARPKSPAQMKAWGMLLRRFSDKGQMAFRIIKTSSHHQRFDTQPRKRLQGPCLPKNRTLSLHMTLSVNSCRTCGEPEFLLPFLRHAGLTLRYINLHIYAFARSA